MPICKHHGCRRLLKGFNGPKRCEHCSPPLQHLILGRGFIRSHTPGNNNDTDVTDDTDDNGNGNDGKNDSKMRTRSDVRAQQELDDMNTYYCSACASPCYRDRKRVVSESDLKRQKIGRETKSCTICKIMANTEKEHSGQCLYEEGMECYYGLNGKSDMKLQKRGQSMIEASATSGYPMAVACNEFINCYDSGKYEGNVPLRWANSVITIRDRTIIDRISMPFHVFVNTEKETNGYHWAQCMIGLYCYLSQDYTKAVEWYTKSSDQGNPIAMSQLGNCYRKGQGCEQNMKTAFDLYEKSADLGYNYALYNVGTCYDFGWGVTKDLNKAKEWYTKGAAQGHEKAQYQVDAIVWLLAGIQRDKTLEERRQRNQIINKEKLRVGACETCGRVVTPENVVHYFKWAHRDRATWVNVFDWTLTNPKGENGLATCGLVGIRTLVNNSEEYFQKQWPIERAKSKLSCYRCHQKETDENLNCYGIQLYVNS